MKKIQTIILSISLALCAQSCFLDVPPQIISKETFYNSEAEVKYGLAGIYGAMSNESFYGNKYSLMLTNVDDLSYFNRTTTSNFAVWYEHDATAAEVYEAWIQIYHGIRNANAFMEAMKICKYDEDGKFYNEARFLRAYYHFILAQGWGDVPMRTKSVDTPTEVFGAATPQAQVLDWCLDEMIACLDLASEDITEAPSRLCKTSMQGIIARVALFTAGESVKGASKTREQYLAIARDQAHEAMLSQKHDLNPSYAKVFQNMVADVYDTEYHESMWEVEFRGNRSSAQQWSNGRIGDLIGLQSTGSNDFSTFKCNYSYAMYNGSLKLWDMYWSMDRIDSERELPNITDARQVWNMRAYNYSGNDKQRPYGSDPSTPVGCKASIDKTPYVYDSKSTNDDPLAAPAIRNCGKFCRETEYEPAQVAKNLYTQVNYPLLRYSDVLLMYAEAVNELSGPDAESYAAVVAVRNRAGVATFPLADYNQESFRSLIRNERGRELCFESLRKFDLIRWGIFEEEMHNYKIWTSDDRWSKNQTYAPLANRIGQNVQHKHILFPIPNVELGVNGLLTQNSLWQ